MTAQTLFPAPATSYRGYRMSAAFIAGYPCEAPEWALLARRQFPGYTSDLPIGGWLIRNEADGQVCHIPHGVKIRSPYAAELVSDWEADKP